MENTSRNLRRTKSMCERNLTPSVYLKDVSLQCLRGHGDSVSLLEKQVGNNEVLKDPLVSLRIPYIDCLDIYYSVNPLNPSSTRIVDIVSHWIYEITPEHYPVSYLLLHPYSSTSRAPSLRVPLGGAGLKTSCPFLGHS